MEISGLEVKYWPALFVAWLYLPKHLRSRDKGLKRNYGKWNAAFKFASTTHMKPVEAKTMTQDQEVRETDYRKGLDSTFD